MLAELSIVPLGRGEHLSAALAEILDLVDRSGIRYKFTPSGTCLEGNWTT
ncbi:MAG TPA: thiamine-binding protein [Thermoanaerobaculia bacterium]